MSLTSWLKGEMPKPSSKRKYEDDAEVVSTPQRKFKKANCQKSYDWYIVDSDGVWHCSVCRNAKLDTAYARGHDVPAKTTNHDRHVTCKYSEKPTYILLNNNFV